MEKRWWLLIAWCMVAGGCASMGFRSLALEGPRVIQPLKEPHLLSSAVICVATPFSSDVAPPRLGRMVADAYALALEARKFGTEVRTFDAENDRSGRRSPLAGCHLVLRGKIERAVVTGGGTPQGMSLRLWLVDTTTEGVIFSVVQEGFSSPGRDRDWYWSSSVGEPAYPIREVAERMAERFGDFLAKEEEKVLREEMR